MKPPPRPAAAARGRLRHDAPRREGSTGPSLDLGARGSLVVPLARVSLDPGLVPLQSAADAPPPRLPGWDPAPRGPRRRRGAGLPRAASGTSASGSTGRPRSTTPPSSWRSARVASTTPTRRAGTPRSRSSPRSSTQPFPYQERGARAWRRRRCRGVVVLPTGAGKTFVATLAILACQRSTLVVVPTLDLLNQWYDVLAAAFGVPIGIVGGGYHEVLDLTVTTYDSAHLHMERLGDRFGLVDLRRVPPPPQPLLRHGRAHVPRALPARPHRHARAPRRRDRGRHHRPRRLPEGHHRALRRVPRRVRHRAASRSRSRPRSARPTSAIAATYLGFLRANGIRMGEPDGWSRFLMLRSQSDTGRRAFAAYRRQRQLALAAPGKLAVLARLLHLHRRRPHHRLHREQRHGLRHLAALAPARHHPPDQGQGAEPHPRRLQRGRARRGGHLQGAQRGRQRARGQRRHRPLRIRIGARARAAPRPHPPQGARTSARSSTSWSPRTRSEERTSDKRREHVAYR